MFFFFFHILFAFVVQEYLSHQFPPFITIPHHSSHFPHDFISFPWKPFHSVLQYYLQSLFPHVPWTFNSSTDLTFLSYVILNAGSHHSNCFCEIVLCSDFWSTSSLIHIPYSVYFRLFFLLMMHCDMMLNILLSIWLSISHILLFTRCVQKVRWLYIFMKNYLFIHQYLCCPPSK